MGPTIRNWRMGTS